MGTDTHRGDEDVKRATGGSTSFKESRLQRRDANLRHGRYESNGNWMCQSTKREKIAYGTSSGSEQRFFANDNEDTPK